MKFVRVLIKVDLITKEQIIIKITAYSEAVHRVWPEGETVEVVEDGSVDGFQFDKKDGNWSQCYEIVIITSN